VDNDVVVIHSNKKEKNNTKDSKEEIIRVLKDRLSDKEKIIELQSELHRLKTQNLEQKVLEFQQKLDNKIIL
jgi:hypothetical protein